MGIITVLQVFVQHDNELRLLEFLGYHQEE
jgi:hypothetical protein